MRCYQSRLLKKLQKSFIFHSLGYIYMFFLRFSQGWFNRHLRRRLKINFWLRNKVLSPVFRLTCFFFVTFQKILQAIFVFSKFSHFLTMRWQFLLQRVAKRNRRRLRQRRKFQKLTRMTYLKWRSANYTLRFILMKRFFLFFKQKKIKRYTKQFRRFLFKWKKKLKGSRWMKKKIYFRIVRYKKKKRFFYGSSPHGALILGRKIVLLKWRFRIWQWLLVKAALMRRKRINSWKFAQKSLFFTFFFFLLEKNVVSRTFKLYSAWFAMPWGFRFAERTFFSAFIFETFNPFFYYIYFRNRFFWKILVEDLFSYNRSWQTL